MSVSQALQVKALWECSEDARGLLGKMLSQTLVRHRQKFVSFLCLAESEDPSEESTSEQRQEALRVGMCDPRGLTHCCREQDTGEQIMLRLQYDSLLFCEHIK